MYQFTTPTISITIPDSVDVSDMTSLVVTLLQGKKKLEKHTPKTNMVNAYLSATTTCAIIKAW